MTTTTDYYSLEMHPQSDGALRAKDVVAFIVAAIMTLAPLAATALYWR